MSKYWASDMIPKGKQNYGHKNKSNKGGNPNAIKATKLANSKPIKCIETKSMYGPLKEASEKTGISVALISACLNKENRTAKGFHFETI